MVLLKNYRDFSHFLSYNRLSLIIFSSNRCSTCISVENKVKNLTLIKTAKVDYNNPNNIAAQSCVFTTPTIIIYLDKQELNRFSGVFSMSSVLTRIKRIKEFMDDA